MTIPADRPVYGSDLVLLRQELGLSVEDLLWALGMMRLDWFETSRSRYPRVVKDPARAIHARVLAERPELSLVGTRPDPKALFARLRDLHGSEMTLKRFSLAFGRSAGAAYRWTMLDDIPDRSAARLMEIWYLAEAQGKGSIFPYFERLAEIEAAARGIADLRRGGSWRKPAKPEVTAKPPRALQKRKSCRNRPRRGQSLDHADKEQSP
jgi:hypothetical protein